MESNSLLDIEQLGDEMFDVLEPEAAEGDSDTSTWAFACCQSASSLCGLS